MPAASYGQFNPAGIDPWPIESTLAQAAATSPVRAEQLLENYQQERNAASNVYMGEAAHQHEFAKQQLQNQLYEARMKALPDLISKPGGAAFLQHGGLAGMTPADISADPSAWAGLVEAGNAANDALNTKNVGQGVQGLSNAGAAFSNVSQVLPKLNIPMGENVQVQRARIDAASKDRATAARGKGGGAGSGGVSESTTYGADTECRLVGRVACSFCTCKMGGPGARSDFVHSRGVVPTRCATIRSTVAGSSTNQVEQHRPHRQHRARTCRQQDRSVCLMARPPANTTNAAGGVTAAQQHVLANEASVLEQGIHLRSVRRILDAKASEWWQAATSSVTPQGPAASWTARLADRI
jgi:hypothetical protein